MKRHLLYVLSGVLAAAFHAHATFAPPYTGTLKRPILFVHGIGTNGYGTWGFERPVCRNPVYTDFKSYIQDYEYYLSYTITCSDNIVSHSSIKPFSSKSFTPPTGDLNVYKVQQEGGSWYLWIHQSTLDGIWLGRSLDYHAEKGWTDSWEQGITDRYKQSSSLVYLAQRYNLDTRFKINDIRFGINHNGLEFYNLSSFDPVQRKIREPWQHPRDQAPLLVQRIEAVLDEYYPDWRTNPDRKIDLVGHSQGGIVIRDAIRSHRDPGVQNPVNHINHIVTVSTPHLGTSFAHNKDGVPTMNRLREWMLFDFPKDFKFDIFWGAMEVNLAKESGIMSTVMELNDNAQHLQYPCGFSAQSWTPSTSGLLQGPLSPKDGTTLLKSYAYQGPTGDYYISPDFSIRMGSQDHPWQRNYEYWVRFWDVEFSSVTPYHGTIMLDDNGNLVQPTASLLYDRTHPDCSEYLGDLARSGYPTWPKGGQIPMTALSGVMNPANLTQLLEQERDTLTSQCDENQFEIIDPDVVSWGSCTRNVDRLVDAFKSHITALSADWIPGSDFIVDVASQQGVGLFNPNIHPFKTKTMVPINPATGVLHMHLGPDGEAKGLYGAAYHGHEIFTALENPPKAKPNVPVSLLLE